MALCFTDKCTPQTLTLKFRQDGERSQPETLGVRSQILLHKGNAANRDVIAKICKVDR